MAEVSLGFEIDVYPKYQFGFPHYSTGSFGVIEDGSLPDAETRTFVRAKIDPSQIPATNGSVIARNARCVFPNRAGGSASNIVDENARVANYKFKLRVGASYLHPFGLDKRGNQISFYEVGGGIASIWGWNEIDPTSIQQYFQYTTASGTNTVNIGPPVPYNTWFEVDFHFDFVSQSLTVYHDDVQQMIYSDYLSSNLNFLANSGDHTIFAYGSRDVSGNIHQAVLDIGFIDICYGNTDHAAKSQPSFLVDCDAQAADLGYLAW